MKHIGLTLSLLVACAALPSMLALEAGAGVRSISPTARLAEVERTWRADLRSGARADATIHFANPSRSTLNARLRDAARRYHFTVISVHVLHTRQAAPLVVVEAANNHAIAASTTAILHLIDPKAPTGDDRTGWAYEGFFFEARDSHSVPFLATFNWWRGPHAGGGQWASDPRLLPYPHG